MRPLCLFVFLSASLASVGLAGCSKRLGPGLGEPGTATFSAEGHATLTLTPPDQAPTDAKASCLYPNSARALAEALGKGFDNAVVLDPWGNVAELATANIVMVKNGVVHTPAANGTFLAGVTRSRVLQLLRRAGITAHERSITWEEVLDADEVFSTGNYGKVLPITRVAKRNLLSSLAQLPRH